MKEAVVDSVIFGYDLDGSGNSLADGYNLSHLDGCAGVHNWGKKYDAARYHMLEPTDKFTKGKVQVNAGPVKTSLVQHVAFGDETDPRRHGESAVRLAEYKKKYEGAIGQFSDEMHLRDYSRGKKLYPNAPQSQTSVDDLLLNRDLQASSAHKDQLENTSDWYAFMEGAAGVPRWNWIDQRDRFTAVIDAKSKARLGRKTCKGAANLECNVDYGLFGRDLDGSEGDSAEKAAWTEMLAACAGRQTREYQTDKNRYQPQSEDLKRMGKRVFANAPQNDTVVDTIAFNIHCPEQVIGYRWEDMVAESAGLGFNRRGDVVLGRYHIDLDAQDKIPGRRLYGTPFTQAVVPQPASSRASSGDVGRPERKLESRNVDHEATTNRAVFQPPSRRALTQAGRRAHKRELVKASSKGVTAAMQGYEEEERTPPRRAHSERSHLHREQHDIREARRDHGCARWLAEQGPLSPSPQKRRGRDLPGGKTLYDRDFHQMPVTSYRNSHRVPAPAWFTHPERDFQKGDERMEAAYKNSTMVTYRSQLPAPPLVDEQTLRQSSGSLRDTAGSERRLPAPPDTVQRSGSLREAADPAGSLVSEKRLEDFLWTPRSSRISSCRE